MSVELPPAPRAMKRVSFFGAKPADMTMDVKLTASAPTGTFTLGEGIVVHTGKAKGAVVFWGDVLHHLRAALPASPAMREALAAILAESEASAVAADTKPDGLVAALVNS